MAGCALLLSHILGSWQAAGIKCVVTAWIIRGFGLVRWALVWAYFWSLWIWDTGFCQQTNFTDASVLEFLSMCGFWHAVLICLDSSPSAELSDIYLFWKIINMTIFAFENLNHHWNQQNYLSRVFGTPCSVGTGNMEIGVWVPALGGLILVEIISSAIEVSKPHTETIAVMFVQEKLLSISYRIHSRWFL